MFYFGVDYYPEQWPEERWPIDAQLMSAAGFNVVRLAEFAWSRLEPEEGRFDFSWLDRAIAILHTYGIRIVLGTPTASAPPWLMQKSSDLFRVRADGQRVTYGNRREYCPNQPIYHDYTRKIVTQMAEHYADHPAVIGWQIDNEFGDRCFCPTCARKFQVWLRIRYETLSNVNQKWGAIFWSHEYNDWTEIPLPLASGGSPNPGLALDFYRFCSDSYVAYQQIQIDILRERCHNQFITHNMMGFSYDQINYFDLAINLDFTCWDNYPRSQWSLQKEPDPGRIALDLAATRGFKNNNFWIIEQQAGQGGWEMLSVAPRPGELRLWAYQTIAHGADAVVFFRWRTALFGTEQYWHGLLDHDARLSRRYEEIKSMGAEIQRAGDLIAGSKVKSSVAMVLSYDSRFAFQLQPNNPRFSYTNHFHQIFNAFFQRNISVDIVDLKTDLSAFKLVIAPALHVLTQSEAENLERFVQTGGTLVVTQRTGVKDEANNVVNLPFPGWLARVCGVEVDEYDSLSEDMQNGVEFDVPDLSLSEMQLGGGICEILKPTSASVIAHYTKDYYARQPAITVNQFGRGQAVYVGAAGDEHFYDTLIGWLVKGTATVSAMPVNGSLEVTERWQGSRRLVFLLNHSDQTQAVQLDQTCTNLLDGKTLSGKVPIGPKDVLIISSDK